MDQGGEWETEFIAVLEQFGILSRVTGAYAPWQNSLAERHGAILGTAWMCESTPRGPTACRRSFSQGFGTFGRWSCLRAWAWRS